MGTNTGTWSAVDVVPLSASATPFPVTRGLLVGTAGTATVTTARGASRANVPLQLGWNPIQITALTALGTASDVWACY